MNASKDAVIARFQLYIERLQQLFKAHGINSVAGLIAAVRSNPKFRQEWRAIWADIARADGGKLSLTTAGIIWGAALGGAGIAVVGTAFGVPLAAVLGLGGFVLGDKWDKSSKRMSSYAFQALLPKSLYERIEAAAQASQVDPRDLIVSTLEEAFPAKYPAVTEAPSPPIA